MAATLDEHGREWLDQTPVECPVPYDRPEPIHLRLRRIVEQYHHEMTDANEYETFDDADDFEVGDGLLLMKISPPNTSRTLCPTRNG